MIEHTRTDQLRPALTFKRPGKIALEVLGGWRKRSLTAEGSPVTVGRSELADLQLKDSSVSGLHCELRLTDKGVHLRDLDSSNGTWVHDCRVTDGVLLNSGAVFRAGSCRLKLIDYTEVEVEVLPMQHFQGMVGSSDAMQQLYCDIQLTASAAPDVLILGETGTGKQLVARALHELSQTKGPFITLDCGALSRSLAEATLFGFRKGAFTGADRHQQGMFEAAHGGTLFIDELGELPLDLQVKLLRAIQEREVTRIGEVDKPRPVELRVICATHRDLRAAATERHFREDLYYRISRMVVRTPPLRERGRDPIELAQHFITELNDKHGLAVTLGEDAAERLLEYAWPGNVRELRNVTEQAAYYTRDGVITADDLPSMDGAPPRVGGRIEDILYAGASYSEVVDAFDRMVLAHFLERCGHNISKTARTLGLARDTLRGRLKKLGLYTRSRQ